MYSAARGLDPEHFARAAPIQRAILSAVAALRFAQLRFAQALLASAARLAPR